MKANKWLGVLEKSAEDNQRVVIHFTQSGVMMLHLNLSEAKPKILRFSSVRLDPSMTDLERRNGLLDFLSRLKTKKYPPAALTWSDGMTFRQLELPPMPPDDLQKAIEWDLKKKYFYNSEENFMGYNEAMEVDAAEGREKLFNIFYCEKKAASVRLSFVQDLGLEIRSMIPSQAALSNFVGDAEPTPEHDVLVCERDGAFARILVVREDRSMLARQVTLGTQEFNFTDEILKKIAEEIKKTIDFYESQKHFRPVSKVVLVGSWEDEERVRSFLSQHIETNISHPDMGIYLSETLSGEDKEFILKNGGLFAGALGAAFPKDDSMNLVPADIKTKNLERRLDRWLNLVLLGVGFLLVLVIAGLTVNINFIKGQMKTLNKEHEEISAKKKEFETILGLEKVRRTIVKGEVYTPSLLKELSYRTPAIITLTEFQYSRLEGTLILRGEIPDTARENVKSVTQYAATLAESPFFTAVTASSTSRDEGRKVLLFELHCVVKGLL